MPNYPNALYTVKKKKEAYIRVACILWKWLVIGFVSNRDGDTKWARQKQFGGIVSLIYQK